MLRVIPARIQTVRELMLPPVLERICEERRGLILCTGTTGSGKSTTLAAMIDYINSSPHRAHHDRSRTRSSSSTATRSRSSTSARSTSTPAAFSSALRAALRQDPDVILVGEMRDYETIETALLAAETGHLVFSTLHTLDATETINRIISVFPPHHQKQIRIQLAQVLKAVISLRLVPRADGIGRVPAAEVLISTAYIRDCIENKEKTKYIREQIALGTSQYGMQTFDQSLYQLYKSGLITLDEALKRATNPDEFRLKIQGVQFTADISREQMEESLQLQGEDDDLIRGGELAVRDRAELDQHGPCRAEAQPTTRPSSSSPPGRTSGGSWRPSSRQRGFPPEEIEEALDRLTDQGYLDDRGAAASFVEQPPGRSGEGRPRLQGRAGEAGGAGGSLEEALAEPAAKTTCGGPRGRGALWRRRGGTDPGGARPPPRPEGLLPPCYLCRSERAATLDIEDEP